MCLDASRSAPADLSPIDGTLVGRFARPTEVLAAEKRWLKRCWLESP
jgi:hypothetical protein